VPVTYRDIKADILGKIIRAEWKAGSPIPGEMELAATYGVARATVNRAMRELVADGIIERKRKSGSRVRLSPLRQARFDIPVARREVEAAGHAYRYRLLSAAEGAAPDWLCARLDLPQGAAVLHLLCLHSADGTPWQFEDRWINLALLPQAREADFSTAVPTEWLIAQIPFSSVEIGIAANAAESAIAAHLDCKTGDPLLLTERATRWNEQPVTYVRLFHRPGHRMTTRY
jgi:GntR family histidine utilization transcriptional repressor